MTDDILTTKKQSQSVLQSLKPISEFFLDDTLDWDACAQQDSNDASCSASFDDTLILLTQLPIF